MFIAGSAKAGEKISLAFECYAWHECLDCTPYDNYGKEHSTQNYRFCYEGIRIAVLDTLMRDFCFDLAVVLQLARFPENNFTAMTAHECLMDAFPYLIQDVCTATNEELRECAAKIREILTPALEKKAVSGPADISV